MASHNLHPVISTLLSLLPWQCHSKRDEALGSSYLMPPKCSVCTELMCPVLCAPLGLWYNRPLMLLRLYTHWYRISRILRMSLVSTYPAKAISCACPLISTDSSNWSENVSPALSLSTSCLTILVPISSILHETVSINNVFSMFVFYWRSLSSFKKPPVRFVPTSSTILPHRHFSWCPISGAQ